MEAVKIKDLYKITKTNNTPLLGNLSAYAFMDGYNTDFGNLDRSFVSEKANFAPVWNTNIEDDANGVLTQFQADVKAFLSRYSENFTRLYTLMNSNYDPLENYRMTETSGETWDGSDTDTMTNAQQQRTDVFGAQSETDSFGQRQKTDAFGAQSETENKGQRQTTDAFGAQTDTDTIGARTKTNEYGATSETDAYGQKITTDQKGATSTTAANSVAAFNTSGLTSREQTQTSDIAHTDTLTENSHSDTKSSLAHTDTSSDAQAIDTHGKAAYSDTHTDAAVIDSRSTNAYSDTHTDAAVTDSHAKTAYTDTHTDAAHTDTKQTAYGREIQRTLERFGNIGVTTSQMMFQSEVDLWKNFNFYDIIFDMLTRKLLVLNDIGYSLF